MPNKRDDLSVVDTHIAFVQDFLRCTFCHKEFRTAHRLKVARKHIRKHVSDGFILMPPDEAELDSDTDTDADCKWRIMIRART